MPTVVKNAIQILMNHVASYVTALSHLQKAERVSQKMIIIYTFVLFLVFK